MEFLSRLLSQPWRCLLFIAVVLLGFSFCPAFLEPAPEWPRAEYDLKIQDPLLDMSTVPHSDTHGPKLTPRLLGPLICHALGLDAVGAVALSSLANLGTLSMLWWFCRRREGLDLATTTLCVTAAGSIYAGCLGFLDMRTYPFDGLAIFLITLGALLAGRSTWGLGVAFFLALWTDERAILAIPAYFLLQISPAQPAHPWRTYASIVANLGVAGLAYGLCRMSIAALLEWQLPMDQVGLSILGQNLNSLPLATTLLFEGWWLLLLFFFYQQVYQRQNGVALLFGLGAVGALLLSFTVIDLSRSTAFLFPLILVGIRQLSELELAARHRVMLVVLVACLVMGNYFIIGSKNIVWRLPFSVEWGLQLIYAI